MVWLQCGFRGVEPVANTATAVGERPLRSRRGRARTTRSRGSRVDDPRRWTALGPLGAVGLILALGSEGHWPSPSVRAETVMHDGVVGQQRELTGQLTCGMYLWQALDRQLSAVPRLGG